MTGVAERLELRDSIGTRPVVASELAFSGRVWDVVRDQVDLGAQLLREIDRMTSGGLRGLDPCDADDNSLVHGGLLKRSAIILS